VKEEIEAAFRKHAFPQADHRADLSPELRQAYMKLLLSRVEIDRDEIRVSGRKSHWSAWRQKELPLRRQRPI
jgi:hypothetical protein